MLFNVIANVNASVVVLTVTFAILLLSYLRWNYNYWKRRNVPCLHPNWLFGNAKELFLFRISAGEFFHDAYENFKKKRVKFGGMYIFSSPALIVIDPEILRNVMVKDFQHFTDRDGRADTSFEPLSVHLLNLKGKKWKDQRSKLTPTFTAGKIKAMFPTLVRCSSGLTEIMDDLECEEVDIKDIVSRYTIDCIGSCAFGIECNSLKDPDVEFNRIGRMSLDYSTWRAFKRIVIALFPNLANCLRLTQSIPSVNDFFVRIVNETIEHREKNGIYRNDFMDLLIRLKNRGTLDDSNETNQDGFLTTNEIAAHTLLFFNAGYDTSASTLTFCLFELAQNLDIQRKLRQEIENVMRKHGNITYDCVTDMKYMDNVVNETLRKHPPLPNVTRVCTKDYKIPGTDVVIPLGMRVFISILGLHKDEEYFPNAERFDPDRFDDDGLNSRHPFTFIPFGEGPRNCIGLRFGLIQVKVGLIQLLGGYEWTLHPRTKLPLRMKPQNFMYSTVDKIWLKARKL